MNSEKKIHSDIKIDNVSLACDKKIKLGDFGYIIQLCNNNYR
jgi:serine/threonine protein kinase